MSTTKDKTPRRGGTYESPVVTDYSDRVELTARQYTDKSFPAHPLRSDLTFSG
jgi:hypothetical protein